MTPNLDDVKSIFGRALEHESPAARAAFLDMACGNNVDLRAEVEALLAKLHEAGRFMDQPAAAAVSGLTGAYEPPTAVPGQCIGRYKLLEEIGDGGMGAVWVAEQTEPVRRKVALKLIKAGMDSKAVLARFEAERQALALMDHPNIAKVLDGGLTDRGRPYFVMEYFKGVPITEYCDAARLSISERLSLFVQVCQAVQHAHQKGIIHRDLKPSNILVAPYDDKPVPKVIDFGLAKAMHQSLTERTLHTAHETVLGTPLYMSPEQAQLNNLDVDTRSDIYSLGVLLYELLTGTTPLEKKRLKEAAWDEMRRVIREEEPPRPSTRLSSTQTLPSLAACRQTEPAKLTKLVRGELDWIVMKALEKDRTRRYETANGFAMDVQRYLAGEPVLAVPPTPSYRLRKFVRRNQRVLATAALAALTLSVAIGAVAGSIGWTVRDREARRTKLTAEFGLMFDEVKQLQEQQKWPDALAAARRAEALVAGGGGDTILEAKIREVLADLRLVERLEQIREQRWEPREDRTHFEWADRAYAAAFRDASLDLEQNEAQAAERLRARARVTPALAVALDDWATCRRGPAAVALYRLAQQIDPDPWRGKVRKAVVENDAEALARLADSPDFLRQPPAAMNLLGGVLCERMAKLKQGVAALRMAQRQYPGDFWTNYILAMKLREPAERDEALGFCRAALAVRPNSAAAWNALGIVLKNKEEHQEAIACYRRAIELNPNDPHPYHNLGNVLRREKKLDEAITSYRKAIELESNNVQFYMSLGVVLCDDKKDYLGASTAFQEAIRLSPKYAAAHNNLGNALYQQRKWDEAIVSYRKAIDFDGKFAEAHFHLGHALHVRRKIDEAIEHYRKAIQIRPGFARAHHSLGRILHYDQQKLDEAIDCYIKAIALDDANADAHCDLGRALASQNKLNEAIAAYRKVIQLDPQNAQAHYRLGDALCKKHNLQDAVAHLRKAVEIDANLAPAHTILTWIRATAADLSLRDPKAALFHARKAVELRPNDPNNTSNLGVALLRAGEFKAAVETLEKADGMWKGDHQHRIFLAMAYWQIGEKDKARLAYDQAVQWMDKNRPNDEEPRRFRAEAAEMIDARPKKD